MLRLIRPNYFPHKRQAFYLVNVLSALQTTCGFPRIFLFIHIKKEGAGILLTVKLNYRNTFFEEASLRKTISFNFANTAD